MIELFQMGGILFMSILTLQLFAIIVLAVRYTLKKEASPEDLDLVKSAGLLAAITGVLGQLIGLFSAFQTIEQVPVSPAMMAGGFKVSSITTIYGLLIYIIALSIWGGLRLRLLK